MLPDIVPDSVGLEKMLSIKVLECSVTLVGRRIWGRIRLEPKMSRKDEESDDSSHFRRSMLKSPDKRICFSSDLILCRTG